jgi:hypothetical protein
MHECTKIGVHRWQNPVCKGESSCDRMLHRASDRATGKWPVIISVENSDAESALGQRLGNIPADHSRSEDTVSSPAHNMRGLASQDFRSPLSNGVGREQKDEHPVERQRTRRSTSKTLRHAIRALTGAPSAPLQHTAAAARQIEAPGVFSQNGKLARSRTKNCILLLEPPAALDPVAESRGASIIMRGISEDKIGINAGARLLQVQQMAGILQDARFCDRTGQSPTVGVAQAGISRQREYSNLETFELSTACHLVPPAPPTPTPVGPQTPGRAWGHEEVEGECQSGPRTPTCAKGSWKESTLQAQAQRSEKNRLSVLKKIAFQSWLRDSHISRMQVKLASGHYERSALQSLRGAFCKIDVYAAMRSSKRSSKARACRRAHVQMLRRGFRGFQENFLCHAICMDSASFCPSKDRDSTESTVMTKDNLDGGAEIERLACSNEELSDLLTRQIVLSNLQEGLITRLQAKIATSEATVMKLSSQIKALQQEIDGHKQVRATEPKTHACVPASSLRSPCLGGDTISYHVPLAVCGKGLEPSGKFKYQDTEAPASRAPERELQIRTEMTHHIAKKIAQNDYQSNRPGPKEAKETVLRPNRLSKAIEHELRECLCFGAPVDDVDLNTGEFAETGLALNSGGAMVKSTLVFSCNSEQTCSPW